MLEPVAGPDPVAAHMRFELLSPTFDELATKAIHTLWNARRAGVVNECQVVSAPASPPP
jgi:hypothetical protein